MNSLSNKIELLPSTSSVTIRKLKSLGINTYFDLLNYFPSRYEDYSLITKISGIQEGETVTIKGKIIEAKNQYTRSRITIQKVLISDDTGIIEVSWFNQPYLIRVMKIGETISISGLVKRFGSKIVIEPKEYEIGDKRIHTGRVVPIYPEKKGLSIKTIREKIHAILVLTSEVRTRLAETLPKETIEFNSLIERQDAYEQVHFPDSLESANKARERLAFDELFSIQLSSYLVKQEWKKEKVGNRFKVETRHTKSLQAFIDNLPFELTSDQNKVINEIISDLKKITPMNRFLQGDVGSGKTVVAAIASYLSFLNGYQSVIMAPTEILAQQHYLTIVNLFKKVKKIKISLITSSQYKVSSIKYKNSAKNILNTKYSILDTDILIGTHALLNQKLKFKKVGLVVIDEQHRFGVNQRALLKEKTLNAHLLTMTATPIPRTVALTLYGELDLSYIEEMPKGRQIIKTYLVPREKRSRGYQWMKEQITKYNSQIFIVCPFIEESVVETMKSIKAVKIEFENLKNIFSEFKLGLLHGKMKSAEKEKAMSDFKSGKINILVSTPVVEVGIDIPGATIMLIEGAERFGLAQLHQLRGRVGRSDKQSYCFLFTENQTDKTNKRLDFFCKNYLGIKLAKFDLENRGAGNIFGTEQHGFVDFKIASLSDFELIDKTKKAVEYFVGKYDIKDWEELKKGTKMYRKEEISRD